MSPDTDRITRAQTIASVIVLANVWMFLFAIVLQNTQRTAPATSAVVEEPATLLAGRAVAILITDDNQVFTNDRGLIQSHVPLLQCPGQQIAVEVSENGPFISMSNFAGEAGSGFRASYVVWVDRPYSVMSSRMGIDLHFDNDERVSVRALCDEEPSATHFMAVFVRDDMVYLADMTANTAAPLFSMEQGCQLVWESSGIVRHAFPWEMNTPLNERGTPSHVTAGVAFTFDTVGAAQLHAADAHTYQIISESGITEVRSECPVR